MVLSFSCFRDSTSTALQLATMQAVFRSGQGPLRDTKTSFFLWYHSSGRIEGVMRNKKTRH